MGRNLKFGPGIALAISSVDRVKKVRELPLQGAGKAALFDTLKSHLSLGIEEAVPYDELSARLCRPAATLRKDVERLRARYGDILREEVRGTVTDPGEVDVELRYLCQALTT